MNKHNRHTATQEHHELSGLAEDAQALMTATADVAGEKVAAARQRLSAALENLRDKVVEKAKSTDKAVRENPYQTAGIALGVGLLLGLLLGRRSRRD